MIAATAVLSFVSFAGALAAEPAAEPTWVFLRAKPAGDPAALAATADPRQVARRQQRRTEPGLFDERDLPLDPGAVAAVSGRATRVRAESRWLNAVSVDATPAQRAEIARLPMVARVAPVARGVRGVEAEREVGALIETVAYGQSQAQLTQIGLPALHDAGFTGAGVRVAVLDTGFRTTHAAFNNPAKPLRVVASRDFINDDNNVGVEPSDHPDQHRHGTWILGTLAAYLPGTLVGAAFDAEYVLAKTEDYGSETPIEEDYYVEGIEWAESLGCDLATSSLGYIDWYTQADLDGATAVTTLAVNIATANGMHCITAAGNEGNDANPATARLIAPADAPLVITVGAVDAAGATASFSSDGPTADGRVKPEVLARGIDTRTVSSAGDTNIIGQNGTSLSTPLVAGAIACLVQARPEWTVGQMRRAVMRTSDRFASLGTPDPLFVRGYGIMNANAARLFPVCPADLDGSGEVDLNDFFAFFACYDAASGCADIDGTPGVDLGDFFAFFAGYDLACP